MMSGTGGDIVLRIQQGGRLTIPRQRLDEKGITKGDIVLVRIRKAVIKPELEVEGE